ncbi:MAG: chromate transporter [Bryobacteraceae bacterium]
MSLPLLYLLLLKATLTSFSGMSSLPIIHHDFVVRYRVLTENQLSAAVAAGRATPGPIGLYVTSVGYFAAGVPGALAGTVALMTPAFLIIPMLRYLSARTEQPRVRSAIQAVTLAAAGLLAYATVPMARAAITGWVGAAIALGSFAFAAFTRRPTLWAIGAAALIGLATR